MRSMYPTIIFFTQSFSPTREEREAAAKYGPMVRYRNAQFVPPDVTEGSIEQCDGVAGLVPEAYAKCRPSADEAMQKHMDMVRDELSIGLKAHVAHATAVLPAAAVPEPQPAPTPSPFAGRAPLPFPKPTFGNPKAKPGPPGFGA